MYRIPYKPNQRPAWDKCKCRWTQSMVVQFTDGLYHELPLPLFKSHKDSWFCCWCNAYKGIHCSIKEDQQFCPECGHARDLRPGEFDQLIHRFDKRYTRSTGPK